MKQNRIVSATMATLKRFPFDFPPFGYLHVQASRPSPLVASQQKDATGSFLRSATLTWSAPAITWCLLAVDVLGCLATFLPICDDARTDSAFGTPFAAPTRIATARHRFLIDRTEACSSAGKTNLTWTEQFRKCASKEPLQLLPRGRLLPWACRKRRNLIRPVRSSRLRDSASRASLALRRFPYRS